MITLEDWQTGRFRNFPEFKTQEGYYPAISRMHFVKGRNFKTWILNS